MINKLLPAGFFLALLTFSFGTKAQLSIDNATFIIQAGATVTVQGDLTSNTKILGSGKINLNGSATQNVNMNGFGIPNLIINNPTIVNLTGHARIDTTLEFGPTGGKIQTGNFNLTLSNVATMSGQGAAKFVVTNGSGKLIKSLLGNTPFTYPVGSTTTTYNPVTLSNSGVQDDIGVHAISNALSNGTSGAPISKEVVDASWDISEASPNGSNLTITATWNATDELPGFNRIKAGISRYITNPASNAGWDLLNSQTSAATGTNPYSFTRSGITELGAFAVGARPVLSPLLVYPKIFLQGAYNTSTGLMNDNLRTLNLIPTTEPYTATANFIHSGSGGAETSTAAIVGSGAPASTNSIVDWVFVQLHDGITGNVVSTRAVLLQKDGDIVETDGVSPVNMAGNAAGNYYISVRHRNHLGVRSLNNLALSKVTASNYNFTNAQSQAFAGAVSNNPMSSLGAGIFGMWGGNANDDIVVKMTGLSAANNDYLKLINTLGSSTNTLPNIYSKQDINMDGTIKMTGLSPANNDYLKLLNILGSSISTISQPVF